MKPASVVPAVIALLVVTGVGASADNGGRVTVQVPSVLSVEHPTNSATGLVHVRNPGRSPARITLSATDFVTPAGRPLNATVRFSVPGGTAPAPVYDATLEPGALRTLQVDVANVWEAGEATAKILDGAREVAVLRAAKYRVPLAVRVVGEGDNPVVLTLRRGQPAQLVLKNDDAMTYHVEWRLTLGTDSATGQVALPPTWTTEAPLTLNPRWFAAPLEGFVKDELRDGTLAVRLLPASTVADPGLPERVVPVRARLVYWSSPLRQPLTMLVVFAALLAGGLTSLMLNQWFPNRLRRIDLEERLGDIAARTRNLSFRVDSSLRILVRVERYRLLRLLGSRYAFSPEMARVLGTSAQATDRLEARVALLERIDAVDADAGRLALAAPPTVLAAVETRLQKAADRLRSNQPADADLQDAGRLVTEAVATLAALQQPDPEFARALGERFMALREALGPQSPLRKTRKADELIGRLRGLVDYLDGTPPDASLRADSYQEHDLRLLRLDLVHQYLRLHGEQSDEQRRRAETEGEPAFIGHLAAPTPDAYRQALLDLRALREDIFTSRIEEEIRRTQIRIEAQPPDPRPHQAVELAAVFASDAFNRAGARDDYECWWTFRHVDSDGRPGHWLEKGWRVHHFFPRPDRYEVRATFRRKDGTVVADETRPIEVVGEVPVGSDNTSWFSDRTWIEAVRFGVVLFATILGLLGGAREQLMKLDVLAGLVAVFLIGFGADAVKNMLIERGGAAEAARKSATAGGG